MSHRVTAQLDNVYISEEDKSKDTINKFNPNQWIVKVGYIFPGSFGYEKSQNLYLGIEKSIFNKNFQNRYNLKFGVSRMRPELWTKFQIQEKNSFANHELALGINRTFLQHNRLINFTIGLEYYLTLHKEVVRASTIDYHSSENIYTGMQFELGITIFKYRQLSGAINGAIGFGLFNSIDTTYDLQFNLLTKYTREGFSLYPNKILLFTLNYRL